METTIQSMLVTLGVSPDLSELSAQMLTQQGYNTIDQFQLYPPTACDLERWKVPGLVAKIIIKSLTSESSNSTNERKRKREDEQNASMKRKRENDLLRRICVECVTPHYRLKNCEIGFEGQTLPRLGNQLRQFTNFYVGVTSHFGLSKYPPFGS